MPYKLDHSNKISLEIIITLMPQLEQMMPLNWKIAEPAFAASLILPLALSQLFAIESSAANTTAKSAKPSQSAKPTQTAKPSQSAKESEITKPIHLTEPAQTQASPPTDPSLSADITSDPAYETYVKAENFGRSGQYHDAVREYDAAIKINPKFARAYYGRGLSYQLMGIPDKAMESYNQGLEVDPDNAKLYNNRGTLFYQQKQYDKALEDLKKAQDLFGKQGNFRQAQNLKPIIEQLQEAVEALK